jgi:hypothetical protein
MNISSLFVRWVTTESADPSTVAQGIWDAFIPRLDGYAGMTLRPYLSWAANPNERPTSDYLRGAYPISAIYDNHRRFAPALWARERPGYRIWELAVRVNPMKRDEVETTWQYLTWAGVRMIDVVKANAADVYPLDSSDAIGLREDGLPRYFSPWTWLRRSAHAPDLVEAVQSLPDCQVSELEGGVLVRALEHYTDRPTQRFLDALAELPVSPPWRYHQPSFKVFRHGEEVTD